MAGVYIPKLKKAKSCDECDFLMSNRDYAVCAVKMAIFLTNDNQPGIVNKDTCPMVKVPDHGDLIDREELIKKIVNTPIKALDGVDFDQAWFTRVSDTAIQFVDEVERQVAIIQADKEGV